MEEGEWKREEGVIVKYKIGKENDNVLLSYFMLELFRTKELGNLPQVPTCFGDYNLLSSLPPFSPVSFPPSSIPCHSSKMEKIPLSGYWKK